MKTTPLPTETGITAMPVADLIPSIEFQPGKPSEYAANIRRLADLVKFSGEAFTVNTIRLGRYCRDVKHELALKGGDQGFQKWIEEAVPNLSYNSVAVAMRTAKMIGDAHPELRRLDSPETVEALSRLVDGKTFTAVAQEFGAIKRPANVDPATGKRLHHPIKKTEAERAEDKPALMAGHWMAALETLERETTQGGFSQLDEAQAELAYGRLLDLSKALLDTVIQPRREAKKGVSVGKLRKP